MVTGSDRRPTRIANAVLDTAPGTDRPEAQLLASGRGSNGLLL